MAQESLPFDQGFVLKKVYDNPVDIFDIGYFEIKRSQMKDYFITERQATKTGLKFKFIKKETKYELYIFVPPLNPNRFYDFMITTKLPKTDSILMEKYLELFGYINA